MVITWEDALAASRDEGKDEGGIVALRNGVLRVLKERFTSVPAFVSQKLKTISNLERLEDVLEESAVVSSVDELGLEP